MKPLSLLVLIYCYRDDLICRSLAKVTKPVKIEKSKLFFVIPKTISVIPYPYNFLFSYPLSLKLFCQLSLIPKTPNRASLVNAADEIYKLQNISKTTPVLVKTPLLTLKLMMCGVASYQIYAKIFVLHSIHGIDNVCNLSSLLSCAWPKP